MGFAIHSRETEELARRRLTRAGLREVCGPPEAQASGTPARTGHENATVQKLVSKGALPQAHSHQTQVSRTHSVALSPALRKRKLLGLRFREQKDQTYIAAAQRISLNSLLL